MLRLINLAVCLILLSSLAGCSVLGFSTYPVAHLMTKDTKAALERTPAPAQIARELSKECDSSHLLQPGDELLVEVLESETDVQLPADQRVMVDGSIDLGKYGRVVVCAMTLEEAESLIQQTLLESEDKPSVVNVRLIQPSHRYYVVGEVNSPGAYMMRGNETVLDAILEAGGLTERASACDLLLARPTAPCSCRVTLPVCYRAITQLGDTTTNYHIKAGDRIFVGKQSFHEELFAYCRGAKTCDRCCKCQVPCVDPINAGDTRPRFMPSSIQRIQPPVNPTPAPLPDGVPMPEPRWNENGSTAVEEIKRPTEATSIESEGLDGELQFDALLRESPLQP